MRESLLVRHPDDESGIVSEWKSSRVGPNFSALLQESEKQIKDARAQESPDEMDARFEAYSKLQKIVSDLELELKAKREK